MSLQDSVPLINATNTWNLNEDTLNLTGEGQSVCIIDTGINYSHKDFGSCVITNLSLNGNIVNLDIPIQSAHNYLDNYDNTWKINYTGFTNISIHFVNLSLEYQGQSGGLDSYDRIIIYDANMNEIASYHGESSLIQDLWTPSSSGDTIYVRLISDSSINKYGFYIDKIINGTTTTNYNWNNCSKIKFGWDFVNNDPNPYDDEGHGTHVAGIVSANGGIKGVAPNSNLVIAKALDSNGDGWESDIMYAIDWCVNKSQEYNISVISMSLGGGQYNTFCDDGNILADPINNAVLNNLSVVVATGNTNAGYPNPVAGISSPACIQNAIRVTATNKSDNYASYAFRHPNFTDILIAPGSSINSTSISGEYTSLSGTSMATPHVAGAIAIINQYLRLTGRTKTPEEIETALFNTGKTINDTGYTNFNFSRINIYNAIISLDNENPNINLISPSESYIILDQNQTFQCNATDLSLRNVTFYLWNSTSVYNQTSYNLSGSSYNLEINLTNIPFEDYKWNCLFTDENSNSAFASSNFSITLGNISTSLVLPQDNNYTNLNNLNFSCNSFSVYSLSNITFYLWNSTSLVYSETRQISGLSNTTTFNFSLLDNEDYKWNCLSTNNNQFSSFASGNNTLIFDSEAPIINLVTDSETSTSTTAHFYFNVSDLSSTNCSLIINNVVNQSKNVYTNGVQSFSQTLSLGIYDWYISCIDLAGNQASSSQKTLTITSSNNNVNTGGSGSSGGTSIILQTYTLNQQQVTSGYTQSLAQSEKIRFNILNDNHTLTLSNLLINSVNLIIQSNPINLTLYTSQEIKLNLTSPSYYDLYIKLNSISNNKANITIKQINENINKEVVKQPLDKGAPKLHIAQEGNNKTYLFLIIVIVVVLLIIYFGYLKISKQKNIRNKHLNYIINNIKK